MVEVISSYVHNDESGLDDQIPQLDIESLAKLQHQQEAMEREMRLSQRVKPSALEELNLAPSCTEQKLILIAKDMHPNDKAKLLHLLRRYKDVFAWLFEDMNGLDPAFCQHQIHL